MTDTTPLESGPIDPAEREAIEARIRAEIAAEQQRLAAAGYEYERDATPEEVAAIGAKPIQGTAVRVFRQKAERPDVATLEEQWRESEPRHIIFTVEREDGTKVDYTMPAAANPTYMLRFMKRSRVEGDAALVDLFLETLSPSVEGAPDAYDAILEETAGESAESIMDTMRVIAQRIAGRLTKAATGA